MGRGVTVAAAKTNNIQVGAVLVAQSTAVAGSAGKSMAQRGRSRSKEASSTFQDRIHHKVESATDAMRTSHVHAGTSPKCNLAHAWLLEVESKHLNDPETGPYCDAEGLRWAYVVFQGMTRNM